MLLKRTDYFELGGDHAEEMETSIILYLKPDLVLLKHEWGQGKEKHPKIKEFMEGWLWAERKWSQISEDTGTGDPKFASKEKGERFFKDVTKKIGTLLIELCKSNKETMYE